MVSGEFQMVYLHGLTGNSYGQPSSEHFLVKI